MICKHYKMSHVVYVSQMAMIHSSMGMVVRRALSVSAPSCCLAITMVALLPTPQQYV